MGSSLGRLTSADKWFPGSSSCHSPLLHYFRLGRKTFKIKPFKHTKRTTFTGLNEYVLQFSALKPIDGHRLGRRLEEAQLKTSIGNAQDIIQLDCTTRPHINYGRKIHILAKISNHSASATENNTSTSFRYAKPDLSFHLCLKTT